MRKPITSASSIFLIRVPRHGLDAAIRDVQTAKANLASLQREAAAALAQLGGNPDMPIDQQASVKQAQAAVDTAARNLRLTAIVAPFDGIPNNVESIAVGAFLNAGQSASPLVSTHDLYVEANIRETDLTYVRADDPARIAIDAYPDVSITGKVTTLAPASGSVFALQGRAAHTGSPCLRPDPGWHRAARRHERQDFDRYRPPAFAARVVA